MSFRNVSMIVAASLLVSTFAFAKNPDAPATIPHSIDEYLPIGLHVNMCTACHQPAKTPLAKKGEIPFTHYVKKGQLNPDRYYCIACHVPQTTKKELKPVDPNDQN